MLYFLAAGNLTRGFRSRELADCAGGRRRMPRTTLALGGWALGISGLTLNTYSVLSATFRDVLPNGGHVSAAAQVVVAVAVLATIGADRAVRVPRVLHGADRRARAAPRVRRQPAARGRRAAAAHRLPRAWRRRGGDPGRASPASPRSPWAAARSPGSPSAASSSTAPPASSSASTRWLLLLALVLARAARSRRDGCSPPAAAPRTAPGDALARARAVLAEPTPAERAAPVLPRGFIAAGERLDTLEVQLLEPIPAAMGESVGAVSEAMARLRSARLGLSLAAAFAVVAMLLAASVLAATGHFPVSIR